MLYFSCINEIRNVDLIDATPFAGETMRKLFILLLGLLLLTPAGARTVEGVDLPEKIELGGQQLVLNGAGVREKFFFDIYVAALYLPRREGDAKRILDQDQPWRMVMHFLYKKVGREKLADGWEEGFSDNLHDAQLARLRARLDHFKSLFPDLHKGEEVVLDYLPGTGVQVRINGDIRGVIKGSDFARALLSVWLGDEPVTDELKRALLGKG